MKLISLTIDGNEIQVPPNITVLEAAQSMDIYIPALCAFPELAASGFCRLCVVDVEGYDELMPACVLKVKDGMIVNTQTPRVIEARRMGVELLIAQHPMQCLTCYRNGKCELQKLARRYGIWQQRFTRRENVHLAEKNGPGRLLIDDKSPAITHDPSMCILCGLCIQACRTIQAVDVIDFARRGCERVVEPAFGQSLDDVECIACGQCIQLCPVNAFYETNEVESVRQALRNPDLHVVGILSPMVGASIGEEFEQDPGIMLDHQLVAALKHIGFDHLFNAAVGADFLVLEESYELLTRVKAQDRLPMFSSSSPAWVKYIEHFYPDKLNYLSSCKSPVQILGTLIKTYYAKLEKIAPERIFTVSFSPCTAEKFERTRPEMLIGGYAAINACLTTKETAMLLQNCSGRNFLVTPPQPYDAPFDEASGAGDIFGAAGGMLEAVMRTFYELFVGKKLSSPEFTVMREPDGFQEIKLKMGTHTIQAAIVHGTGNVQRLMQQIESGEKAYQYVEIKGCPQGCAQGGGEPLPNEPEVIRARARALYESDASKDVRKAHENPVVKRVYEKFLKKPASSHSKKLLHTTFTQRQRYL